MNALERLKVTLKRDAVYDLYWPMVQDAIGTAEDIARRFHETYEGLAPAFGYHTRSASAVPWAQVPEANRRLMIATVQELIRQFQEGC